MAVAVVVVFVADFNVRRHHKVHYFQFNLEENLKCVKCKMFPALCAGWSG